RACYAASVIMQVHCPTSSTLVPYTTLFRSTARIGITQTPGLTAIKTATLLSDNGNGVADAGEEILYQVRVENTGNVTLSDVGVDDPMVAFAGTLTLAPGAVGFLYAQYPVTAADLVAGEIVNTATAHGTLPGGG